MLLYRVLKLVEQNSDRRLVSINEPHTQAAIYADGGYYRGLFDEGDVFGPIRRYEEPPEGASVVVHLRDPRDLLTSLYFSITSSHTLLPELPERLWMTPSVFDERERARWQEEGIDAFVVAAAPIFNRRYNEYLTHLGPTAVFAKYEEMVGDREAWLTRVLDGLGCGDVIEAVGQGLPEVEIPAEDASSHIRQVTPGDHKRKLKSETIDWLNREFGYVLRELDYPEA